MVWPRDIALPRRWRLPSVPSAVSESGRVEWFEVSPPPDSNDSIPDPIALPNKEMGTFELVLLDLLLALPKMPRLRRSGCFCTERSMIVVVSSKVKWWCRNPTGEFGLLRYWGWDGSPSPLMAAPVVILNIVAIESVVRLFVRFGVWALLSEVWVRNGEVSILLLLLFEDADARINEKILFPLASRT